MNGKKGDNRRHIEYQDHTCGKLNFSMRQTSQFVKHMLTIVGNTVLEHSLHERYPKSGHPQSDPTDDRQCGHDSIEDNASNPPSYSPWAAISRCRYHPYVDTRQ